MRADVPMAGVGVGGGWGADYAVGSVSFGAPGKYQSLKPERVAAFPIFPGYAVCRV